MLRKTAGSRSLLACVLVLAISTSPLQAQEDDLTAAQILSRVIAQYRNVLAYRDEAVANSRMLGSRYSGRVAIAFAAPDAAMFRVQAGTLSRVFVANGAIARKWSPENDWVDFSDRGGMFASVKGATFHLGDAAHWIGSLLLPREAYSAGLESLRNERSLSGKVVNNVSCYGIAGEIDQSRLKVWIGKEDFLIRRIEVDDETIHATIDYQPVITVRMTPADIELAANEASHDNRGSARLR